MHELRYGTGRMGVNLPPDAMVLQGPPIPAIGDPAGALRRAAESPAGSLPLAQIIRTKRPKSVAITISDITRPVPNEPIITALLETLNANGVADKQVVVIIGTGMHRASTAVERQIMLGEQLLSRVEVIDHIADDTASHARVSDDPPVSVNRRFVEADLKIVTGLIEPHFMAGYSGGRKGVCPGLVDLQTVQRFHGYKTMGDRRSVEGNLEGNLCHEESLRVARLVGVDFLVNVAITHDREIAGVYAGEMEAAHAVGCRQVAEWTTVRVAEPFDLVITSAGGFPLDGNFYQSVKGMVTALPALHERSTLMIVSACAEIGSNEYTEMMLRYDNDWRRFLRDIAATSRTAKDQWQFQMHTRVLERIGVERLRMANDGLRMEVQRRLCVNPVGGDGDAGLRTQRFIDDYLRANPRASVAVIPEGPYTMLSRGPRSVFLNA
jgi:nickel-dependent lactate racemase